jgi:hypothetical protein
MLAAAYQGELLGAGVSDIDRDVPAVLAQPPKWYRGSMPLAAEGKEQVAGLAPDFLGPSGGGKAVEDSSDPNHSVPVSRGGRHAEALLDHSRGIDERPTQSPPESQRKPSPYFDDPYLPRLPRRDVEWKPGTGPGPFGHHTDKPTHIARPRQAGEGIASDQLHQLTPAADHELGRKCQSPKELGTERGLGASSGDDEGPGRAEVHHTEVGELPGKEAGLKDPVSTYVHTPHEHDQGAHPTSALAATRSSRKTER